MIRSNYRKFALLLVLILTILYLNIFFTKGSIYKGLFLKKYVVEDNSIYSGKCSEGVIKITVYGLKNSGKDVIVYYNIFNKTNRYYTVEFNDEENWDLGINRILNSDNETIFEGIYNKDSNVLIDKNGDVIIGYIDRFSSYIPANYKKMSLYNVASMASYHNDTIRGNYTFLVLAVFLIGILYLEIKYPLLFFKVRHSLWVKNPEPSDYYKSSQKVGYVALAVTIFILLIKSIK